MVEATNNAHTNRTYLEDVVSEEDPERGLTLESVSVEEIVVTIEVPEVGTIDKIIGNIETVGTAEIGMTEVVPGIDLGMIAVEIGTDTMTEGIEVVLGFDLTKARRTESPKVILKP